MKESKIEQAANDLAYYHLGIISSKLITPGETGFPDRIFWLPGGRPLLIEFKTPGEEPRPKQLYQHQRLIKLGYNVQVHDNEIRALEGLINTLETTQLSEEGCEILNRAKKIISQTYYGKTKI